MNFHSLFVGINRYASLSISDLTCATRDAQALYAMFVDSLGDKNSKLLTDEQATQSGILSQLDELKATSVDDLVFIHFSGHGSDTHQLLTHDADPAVLAKTAIPLMDLTNSFSQIPAMNLVLCLDCCFSGGAGAKVFHSPSGTRSTGSVDKILGSLGGTGRVILTASGTDQKALEDRRKGHGLFSLYLLDALSGTPEVVRAGHISFLQLVDYVIRSVESAALSFHHVQQPTLRGKLDGDVYFPILKRGPVYASFFPEDSVDPSVKMWVLLHLTDSLLR